MIKLPKYASRQNFEKKKLFAQTILAIIFFVFIVVPTFAKTTMPPKWHQLNALIDKEIKTINTITKMGPRLKWRLLELNTERIKLIREKENKTFLSASASLRKRKGKEWFFSESKALTKTVRSSGLKLLKQYPRFRYASEVYYTLALNSRDYDGDKETEKFLLRSLKNAIPNSEIIHATKTGLAEFYYNNKRYKEAIRYYSDVLKNERDEWHTKHLYNVSWCYIKTKNYEKAITLARDSFFKSKEKKYISVADQVLDSIGFFYVLGEKVKEGTSFYVENVDSPANYLIKMAKKTAEDKGYELASYVFNQALDNSINKKQYEQEVEIRLSLLEFYRNFKRFDQFWDTTLALNEINKKFEIPELMKVDAITKIRSFVGYLQIRFTKNSKTNVEDFDTEKKERIIAFFDILTQLNPKESDSYHYYQGETLFAISNFEDAFEFYKKSLEVNKNWNSFYTPKAPNPKLKTESKLIYLTKNELKEEKTKRETLKTKIFDSLLASLENGKFSKESKYENTLYTYKNHIDLYPKDERTRLIYSKLFNLYLNAGDLDNSLTTLKGYQVGYKEDLSIQQGMFTTLMDKYILDKNTDKIASFIPDLKAGFLSFKPDYIEKTTLILGSLLFENYKKMDSEGKKSEAAAGYLSLFQSEKYPQSIKAKSAYRASILYLELGDTANAFQWMNTSLTLFNPKERFERKSEILSFVQGLMLAQDFNSSATLANQYIEIYCKSPFKEKEDLYRASVHYQLIEGNIREAFLNYSQGSKCGVKSKTQDEVLTAMGEFFHKNRDYKKYFAFFKKFKHEPVLKTFWHKSLMDIYWDFYLKEEKSAMHKIGQVFKSIFTKKNKTPFQIEMETVLSFNRKAPLLNKIEVALFPVEENFDEALFNTMLEKNLNNLKLLTNGLSPFIKSGYPHLVTMSYAILNEKYEELGEKLLHYTPRNMPKEYIEGFKGAMKQMALNIKQEAKGQRITAAKVINDERILDTQVYRILGVSQILKEIGHRHPASLYVLPKDRIGGAL